MNEIETLGNIKGNIYIIIKIMNIERIVNRANEYCRRCRDR